jgi:hypothetical protein
MNQAVIPVTSSFSEPFIWLSSTPSGNVSYFYKEWHTSRYAKWHLPSSISPSWTKEKEDFVNNLPRVTREHEYLANFYIGDSGVFSNSDLQKLQEENSKFILNQDGTLRTYTYDDKYLLLRNSKHILIGVDWNKTHGTRIVVSLITNGNKFCVIHKERIPKSEFAQHTAIERIVELDM